MSHANSLLALLVFCAPAPPPPAVDRAELPIGLGRLRALVAGPAERGRGESSKREKEEVGQRKKARRAGKPVHVRQPGLGLGQ
jgi:hypothetical protein